MLIILIVVLALSTLYMMFHYKLNKRLLEKQAIDNTVVSKYSKTVHYFYSGNLKLYGELLLAKNSDTIIITVPGWGSNHQKFCSFADLLYENNLSTFSIDLRYQGYSEGTSLCAAYQEPLDVISAIDYLKSLDCTKDLKIVLMGVSMGGATVLSTVDERVSAVVAFAAYSDIARVIQHRHKLKGIIYLYSKLFFMQKFGTKIASPIAIAKNITVPMFLVHCVDDPTVSSKEAQKYICELSEKDNFKAQIYNGASHAPWLNGKEFNQTVVDDVITFIKEML